MSGIAFVGVGNGLTVTGDVCSMGRSGPARNPPGGLPAVSRRSPGGLPAVSQRSPRGLLLERALIPHDLDDPPAEGDRPADRGTVLVCEVFQLKQLQLGQQSGERIIERVLEPFLARRWLHECSGVR